MERHHHPRYKLFRHIPKRHIIIFLCCCYTFNANIIREMTFNILPIWANQTEKKYHHAQNVCKNLTPPFPPKSVSVEPDIMYSFTEEHVELMRRAYYMAASLTKLPGGVVADKYGGRKVILYYGTMVTMLILVCPSIIRYCDGNYMLLVGWNGLLGFISGPLFPTVNSLMAQWTPKFRRTTNICFVSVTFSLGVAVGRTLLRYIAQKTGYWPSVYYVWAILVIGTTVLWYFLGHSSVELHPFITTAEKRYLLKDLGRSLLPFRAKKIPWSKILTSIPFWASWLNHLGRGWAFFNLYLYVPRYLDMVLKTDLNQNYVMGQIIPFTLLGLSDLCNGILCDYLVNRAIMDVTTTRKIFSNFGAVGVGIYTLTTSLTGCNQKLAYALVLISLIYMGAYNTGAGANDIDLSVNFAGTMKGITDSSEHLLTLSIPYMLDQMLKKPSIVGWRYTFIVLLAVVMVSNVAFTIAGRAREQSWNLPSRYREEKQ